MTNISPNRLQDLVANRKFDLWSERNTDYWESDILQVNFQFLNKIRSSNIQKKSDTSEIENGLTSTILIKSSWFNSKIKYPWNSYFDKVLYGLTKKLWILYYFQFLQMSNFFSLRLELQCLQYCHKMSLKELRDIYQKSKICILGHP